MFFNHVEQHSACENRCWMPSELCQVWQHCLAKWFGLRAADNIFLTESLCCGRDGWCDVYQAGRVCWENNAELHDGKCRNQCFWNLFVLGNSEDTLCVLQHELSKLLTENCCLMTILLEIFCSEWISWKALKGKNSDAWWWFSAGGCRTIVTAVCHFTSWLINVDFNYLEAEWSFERMNTALQCQDDTVFPPLI